MELRPYQLEAKRAIQLQWASGVRRTLLVLPTGTGKTIVFAKLVEDEVDAGRRCLVLAHRGELLEQAADKLSRATGLKCAVEKADESALSTWFRVTVGSIQSLMRQDRLERFKPDHYQTIIVDEAHHVLADSYQRILKYFDHANVLGVTATPDRGDMKNLGQFFESIAYEYPLPRAIKEGYLCKIKALTIPLRIDLGHLSTQAGDFKLQELNYKLAPYLIQIAEHIKEHCQNRKTVVFLPLIATSQKMQEILQAHGLTVAEVNGESPDRSEILRDFDAGRYQVLCNSMLLTEGWDCPSVDCIVCLRPTKIRSLYCQIIGRGTRILPTKDHLLLLDFLWHTERHELCRPAHLICESAEVCKKMVEEMEKSAGSGPIDIEDAEQHAAGSAVAEREKNLAKKLSEMRGRKRKLVDPLQYEMSIMDADLANYVPTFGWEMAPVSNGQKLTLEKLGIFPDEIENAGKASVILDRLSKRREAGLTTPKQIRFLENLGFQHVGTWRFSEATKLINRIAANRWRVPFNVKPETYCPAA